MPAVVVLGFDLAVDDLADFAVGGADELVLVEVHGTIELGVELADTLDRGDLTVGLHDGNKVEMNYKIRNLNSNPKKKNTKAGD